MNQQVKPEDQDINQIHIKSDLEILKEQNTELKKVIEKIRDRFPHSSFIKDEIKKIEYLINK